MIETNNQSILDDQQTSQGLQQVVTIGHRFQDASIETEALKSSGIEVIFLGDKSKEEAIGASMNAHGVLIGASYKLDASDLRRLKACRVIVRYGVGVDNIDLEEAITLGMTVCNVPDYGVEEVADHALALLLALARNLDVWASLVQSGKWGISLPRVQMRRLRTTTLGVIGAGRIGRALIERARVIWGRILVYDPYLEPEEINRLGVEKSSLDSLLVESDFVTLHLPSNEATKGLLSEKKLGLMRQGAVLVNCSRGDIIDEQALISFIANGHIKRAGLDVFMKEPPNVEGIISLPQVWPSPHIAYLSTESIIELRQSAATEAGRVLRGEKPLNPVASP